MNKTVARMLCLLLALAACCVAFASCKDGGEIPEQTTPEESGNQETLDPNSEEALLMPDQDPLDFDFKILANLQWYNNWQYGYDLEANGDPESIMDKATYQRQEFLYNRYGINIVLVPSDNAYNTLAQSATSGTYAIDVVALIGTDSMAAAQSGYLYDLNQIRELNLGASYYDQNIQNEYRIGDHLFQIDGVFSNVDDFRTQVVGFSVNLWNNYQLEETWGSIYDLVRNMEWTYETMYEMYRGTGRDVNDDGQMTDVDMFGINADSSQPYVFMMGGGLKVLDNVNGELSLAVTPGSAAYQEMIDVLQDTLNGHAQTQDFLSHDLNGWTENSDKAAEGANIFARDQMLFRACCLGSFTRHLGTDFKFGLLPTPAYYSGQERYYNMCMSNYHEPLGLAVNGQPDLSRAARALEILAYHSMYIPETSDRVAVNYAFYDQLSELRLSQTPDDTEMLSVYVFPNRIYDLDAALNLVGMQQIATNVAYHREYDQLVSDIASRLGSADDQLYVLLQSIEGNIPKLPDNY